MATSGVQMMMTTPRTNQLQIENTVRASVVFIMRERIRSRRQSWRGANRSDACVHCVMPSTASSTAAAV